MRQAVWCVVLGCLVLSTGEAVAFTGNDYQKLTATERALYVAGAVEGLASLETMGPLTL